ncbi:hypothetical protein HYT18_01615 [Candidatus Microgenomates bacterium]|nr:hypothetical protein [Candidatus Microgenomates bacterium]
MSIIERGIDTVPLQPSLAEDVAEKFPQLGPKMTGPAQFIEGTLKKNAIEATLEEKWDLTFYLLWASRGTEADESILEKFNINREDFTTRCNRIAEDERLVQIYDLLDRSIPATVERALQNVISDRGYHRRRKL